MFIALKSIDCKDPIDEILALKSKDDVAKFVPLSVKKEVAPKQETMEAVLADFIPDQEMDEIDSDLQDMDWIRGTPLKVQVTGCTTTYGGATFDPEKHYKMTSSPRGACLIINNEFKGQLGDERNGTNFDKQSVGQLFTKFNFIVKVCRNVNSGELTDKLDDFKRYITKDMDCCVVIVMSHGEFSTIEMNDGVSKNIYLDLIYHFDHERCPVLKDKPKLFIFQSCQGFPDQDASERTSKGINDVLICFPTIPGNAAYRDGNTGSPYIYSLTKVFMQNAHNTDIETMLKTKVREEIEGMILPSKWKRQFPSTSQCGSFKKLFFNPPTSN